MPQSLRQKVSKIYFWNFYTRIDNIYCFHFSWQPLVHITLIKYHIEIFGSFENAEIVTKRKGDFFTTSILFTFFEIFPAPIFGGKYFGGFVCYPFPTAEKLFNNVKYELLMKNIPVIEICKFYQNVHFFYFTKWTHLGSLINCPICVLTCKLGSSIIY